MCVRNQLNTAQQARVVGSSQAAKNTKTTVFFGFELAYNLNTDTYGSRSLKTESIRIRNTAFVQIYQ